MEIRPLTKDIMLTEALCGSGGLLQKPDLTPAERMVIRSAEVKVMWLEKMIPRGLMAQIAYEEEEPVGFIEYMPIELSNYQKGEGLCVINCMVAPHIPPGGVARRERIPGCGSALVSAMIEDVRGKCDGIVAPRAIAYTSDLKGFFEKIGFEEFENKGMKKYIRRFRPGELPEPVRYESRYQFRPVAGKVVVDTFWSSMCRVIPHALLKLREASSEAGENVVLNEFCVDERENLERYGIDDVTYFNGRLPHHSYQLFDKEKIRDLLEKAKEPGQGEQV
jgi:hypothetical protein